MSLIANTDEPDLKESFCAFGRGGRCRYENRAPCPWGWLPVSYEFRPVMPLEYVVINLTIPPVDDSVGNLSKSCG